MRLFLKWGEILFYFLLLLLLHFFFFFNVSNLGGELVCFSLMIHIVYMSLVPQMH